MMQREAAESPNLDPLAGGKDFTHVLEQSLYGKLHILVGQMLLIGGNELDQLRLGHCVYQQTRHAPLTALRWAAWRPFDISNKGVRSPPGRNALGLSSELADCHSSSVSWERLSICSLSRSPSAVVPALEGRV